MLKKCMHTLTLMQTQDAIAEHEAIEAAKAKEEAAEAEIAACGSGGVRNSKSKDGKAAAGPCKGRGGATGLPGFRDEATMPPPSGKPNWQVTLDDPVLIPGSGLTLDTPPEQKQQGHLGDSSSAQAGSDRKEATTLCIPHPTYRQLLQWCVLEFVHSGVYYL
jgi:hypothetical protein